MVMIAKCLLKSANLVSPRIIIITDRIELDGQIESTFKAYGLEPKLATISAELIKLIRSDVSIITTVINTFQFLKIIIKILMIRSWLLLTQVIVLNTVI
ncbi:Type I site-specific restriction-modification system, R (restriction) subunit [Rickettsia conorii subsp. heilongjiangensis 054]|nr:Type I site-specific restriction-modification system, R (restriction) subunit [Rickettsia conorii subsp. heilongjiangensis 054]